MKKTPWYPCSIKPVRNGMYQTLGTREDGRDVILWRYWNGVMWGWGFENMKFAISWSNKSGGFQDQPWRGLTKQCK